MQIRPGVVALLVALSVAAANAKYPLRKPHRGFQSKVPAFTIQPSEDWEACIFGHLSNRNPVDVTGFELHMPEGAHHFVLWKYDGDPAKAPTEWKLNPGCTGLSGDGSLVPNNLFGMQTPNGRVRLPAGVAVRLEAHQPVLFNPHMKNFGPDAVTPDVRFNVIPAKKGSVKHYAESLTVGNTDAIHIPAASKFKIALDWVLPDDLYIVEFSTHQHSLGTRTSVDLLDQPGGTVQRNIITNDSWDHAVEWWPQEPELFRKGQVIRTTCEWNNPRDHEVAFGVETTDEMCFLTGYMYKASDRPLPACEKCFCVRNEQGLLCFSPAVQASTF